MRRLAGVFGESISSLFSEPAPPSVWISRPGERSLLTAPKGQVAYERLTAGNGQLEVLRAVLEPGQVSADDRVIEGVAGKPVHVRDHEDVDLHAALVLLTQVGQGGLKLGPVSRLRGLAPLKKDPIHLPAVQAAEGSALVLLDGERKVEGLLFAADSTIDDCPE
jgi:hypothetical protein